MFTGRSLFNLFFHFVQLLALAFAEKLLWLSSTRLFFGTEAPLASHPAFQSSPSPIASGAGAFTGQPPLPLPAPSSFSNVWLQRHKRFSLDHGRPQLCSLLLCVAAYAPESSVLPHKSSAVAAGVSKTGSVMM